MTQQQHLGEEPTKLVCESVLQVLLGTQREDHLELKLQNHRWMDRGWQTVVHTAISSANTIMHAQCMYVMVYSVLGILTDGIILFAQQYSMSCL